MVKILLTGANGFIARSFLERVGNKYDIDARTKEDLNLLDADKVKNTLQRGLYTHIIHTATHDAESKAAKKPLSESLDANLRMFFNLDEHKFFTTKLIYFGSGAEFRNNGLPLDPYGFSKFIINKYAEKTVDTYNIRLFSVYGKHADYRYRIVNNLIAKAILGKDLVIFENQTRSFQYIDDITDTVKNIIDKGHQVGISPKEELLSYYDIAKAVKEVSEQDLKIVIMKGKDYNKNMISDNIKDNIRCIFEYYKSNDIVREKDLLY